MISYKNIILALCFLLTPVSLFAADTEVHIAKNTRCSVCGMFVTKYPAWIARIVHKDKSVQFFDGVKDMMAYYFEPEKYGTAKENEIVEVYVKDYYSLNWLEAQNAFFVTGSDVYGPMGHEFIPFSSKEAAASFTKDHHGKSILTFEKITKHQVDSMRSGHKMK